MNLVKTILLHELLPASAGSAWESTWQVLELGISSGLGIPLKDCQCQRIAKFCFQFLFQCRLSHKQFFFPDADVLFSSACLILLFIRRWTSAQSSFTTRTKPTMLRSILRWATFRLSRSLLVSGEALKPYKAHCVTTDSNSFKRSFISTCLSVKLALKLWYLAHAARILFEELT